MLMHTLRLADEKVADKPTHRLADTFVADEHSAHDYLYQHPQEMRHTELKRQVLLVSGASHLVHAVQE
jgi:hypothetical protein